MVPMSCPILSTWPRAPCFRFSGCEDADVFDPLPELRAIAQRHATPDGCAILPNVTAWSSPSTTPPFPLVYEPMLYVSLQGTKRMTCGDRVLDHRAGTFLLASVDVPVVCQVVEGSAARPYLGVALSLDPVAVASLLLDLPADHPAATGPARPSDKPWEELAPMTVSPAPAPLTDALLRLVRLVDEPASAPFLAPMIERELLFRVLTTEQGAALRQLAREGSRRSQIHRVVKHIRGHLEESLSIEALASIASMSVSSFHRHFKQATGLSPLAYHKQMRLREARRRLIAEPGAVAHVAFSVGYESASQFTREYRRQFGLPPARDAAQLRTR
jgi:AraC-like DNA-binding protein